MTVDRGESFALEPIPGGHRETVRSVDGRIVRMLDILVAEPDPLLVEVERLAQQLEAAIEAGEGAAIAAAASAHVPAAVTALCEIATDETSDPDVAAAAWAALSDHGLAPGCRPPKL